MTADGKTTNQIYHVLIDAFIAREGQMQQQTTSGMKKRNRISRTSKILKGLVAETDVDTQWEALKNAIVEAAEETGDHNNIGTLRNTECS